MQREFSRAKAYASEYEGGAPVGHFFTTRLQRVRELLGTLERGRVLDVGCGPAIIGRLFRGRPIQYYGVDASEDMLALCAEAFRGETQFHFSLGTMERLPFPHDCFDAVLCLGTLEYMPDGLLAIQELARVAKEGALVIVTMHNSLSPYRMWQRYGLRALLRAHHIFMRLAVARRGQRQRAPARPLFRVYSQKILRRMLAAEAVTVEDVVYYDFNIFLSPLDELLPKASTRVSRRLESLCRSRLRWLGSGFIIKGTCRDH